jgi:hypothetical protein
MAFLASVPGWRFYSPHQLAQQFLATYEASFTIRSIVLFRARTLRCTL